MILFLHDAPPSLDYLQSRGLLLLSAIYTHSSSTAYVYPMMEEIVNGLDDDRGQPTISSSSLSEQLDESVSPPSESECRLLLLWCLLLLLVLLSPEELCK